jgi:polysaccharide biosynthesis/export protein
MIVMKAACRITLCLAMLASWLYAQQSAVPAAAPPGNNALNIRPTYVLGPGDQVTIRAFEVEEISDKPFRVDSEGDVNLPLLGKVRAGGLTVEQFEADLMQRLKTLVRNPEVTVTVTQYRTEPVFLNGYFKSPGIYALQGRRTLLEMLTVAGGIQPNASRTIRVTRHLEMGTIPLLNAVVDNEKKVSTVEISVGSLRDNLNPAEDIVLQPLDTISVDRAEMVYVNGEVNKVGGVELGERDSVPVTELVAMVGGFSKDAAPDKARILRQVLNTSRRAEIPVDLKKILAGKERDFPVLPNDVLYVPRSSRGVALGRVGLIAIPMTSALAYVLASRL